MLNIIRMNWYRLWNTPSMIILLFLTAGMAFFSGTMEVEDVKLMQENQEKNAVITVLPKEDTNTENTTSEETGETDDVEIGLFVNTPYGEDEKPAEFLRFLIADMSAGMPLLFICIAVVLFANHEEKSGFIKNISGQVKHRSSIYIGKIAVMAIYIVLLLLVYGAVQYIALQIGFKGEMNVGASLFPSFLKTFAVLYLLYLAFASGLMMLTAILKNNTIGIVTGLFSLCGVTGLLLGLFDTLLGKIVDFDTEKFSFVKYSVSGCLREAGALFGSSADGMVRMIVVGIIFLIVYNGIGNCVFAKRDVV